VTAEAGYCDWVNVDLSIHCPSYSDWKMSVAALSWRRVREVELPGEM
jgi:hypothetical protein